MKPDSLSIANIRLGESGYVLRHRVSLILRKNTSRVNFRSMGTIRRDQMSYKVMPLRAKRVALFLSAAIVLMAWAISIEGKFVVHRLPIDWHRADVVASRWNASWIEQSIRAPDGVPLSGWLMTPRDGHHRAVILVHGGVSNRQSMLSRAEWLLSRGYTCLLIDQRGCGRSGGVVSFGLKEPEDIGAWVG